jgi:hypothetical protein
MTESKAASKRDDFFVQKIRVGDDLLGRNRFDVFRQICAGQRVLHVGCADWPITDLQDNLHLFLDQHCRVLDGFDVHDEAFDRMRPLVKGRLYSRWEQITDAYDIVIAPEVMEHVPNVQLFLRQLDAVHATQVVLTVPDAFQCARAHFGYHQDTKTFVEAVHPDHNCWYTPYTFQNTIRKYTAWTIRGLWFFNGISLLMIASKER